MTTNRPYLRSYLAPLMTALAVGFAAQTVPELLDLSHRGHERALTAAQGQMNFCLGGFEDRKQIVGESSLENPFRQTTLLACQLDGGTPVVLPDLPRPVLHRTALV